MLKRRHRVHSPLVILMINNHCSTIIKKMKKNQLFIYNALLTTCLWYIVEIGIFTHNNDFWLNHTGWERPKLKRHRLKVWSFLRIENQHVGPEPTCKTRLVRSHSFIMGVHHGSLDIRSIINILIWYCGIQSYTIERFSVHGPHGRLPCYY